MHGPNCASVTWLFDPAVLVDDDGTGYIYVGGGVPEGRAADPGTARCCQLGEDMITLVGDPIPFNPPWLFEDSGIVKVGDKYVYSYCTNFSVPAGTPGFQNGEIHTMIADKPLGPFTYADRVLRNPADYFGTGGNNHHCMFSFGGKWYIAYHNQTLERTIGVGSGYRCTFIDAMDVTEDGRIGMIEGTYEGVPQVKAFDPYTEFPATTAACMAGATTAPFFGGGMTLYTQVPSSWTMLSGVDFGAGAKAVTVKYSCVCDGTISIVLDDVNAAPIAQVKLTRPGWGVRSLIEATAELPEGITGKHDVYFVYSAPAFRIGSFRFE